MNYAEFFAEQEEPEVMPNQVAYHLSLLTGEDHYIIHRVLTMVNPELLIDSDISLPAHALSAVASAVISMRA